MVISKWSRLATPLATAIGESSHAFHCLPLSTCIPVRDRTIKFLNQEEEEPADCVFNDDWIINIRDGNKNSRAHCCCYSLTPSLPPTRLSGSEQDH